MQFISENCLPLDSSVLKTEPEPNFGVLHIPIKNQQNFSMVNCCQLSEYKLIKLPA